jgi:hypothetical protein
MKQTLLKIIMTTLSTFVLSFMAIGTSIAAPGPLFKVVAAGNTLTVTPTLNHYYPAMGIKLTSGHTIGGCTPHGNGYCLFAASNTSPKALTLAGPTSNVQGTVCLNGSAQYSCQKINVKKAGCVMGNTCRVFLSSGAYTGDLQSAGSGADGIDGGNNICQALANLAGLGGTWKAWLSTDLPMQVNARDNINYDSGITYVLAGSKIVVANPGGLLNQNLSNRINETEQGVTAPVGNSVWTGTGADGNLLTPTCQGWTNGSAGLGNRGSYNTNLMPVWTGGLSDNCTLSAVRLYCFETS